MKTVLARESQSPPLSLLSELEAESLSSRAAAIHESIARRAYELFEQRGRQDGQDLEDWLCAEYETLELLFIETDDVDDALIVRAQLPKSVKDVAVSVQPQRIILADKFPETASGAGERRSSKRLFQAVSLPAGLDWTEPSVSFEDDKLEIKIPKSRKTDSPYA